MRITGEPVFFKSSYSSDRVECVEVAPLPVGAALRDSKHPDRAVLGFPSSEWHAFLSTLGDDATS
ncbi:DUF397 domain-containing protein [Nocardiopsis chromatogenes]|uniref:DUF397 domain-containing protein n=1 Tax=Nocardiopsis chromatogenes TaxID=280239 RepID=UPI00034C44A8|nr:DUF397 domain-containing protein [Nocardiopsis chromatogenes]